MSVLQHPLGKASKAVSSMALICNQFSQNIPVAAIKIAGKGLPVLG